MAFRGSRQLALAAAGFAACVAVAAVLVDNAAWHRPEISGVPLPNFTRIDLPSTDAGAAALPDIQIAAEELAAGAADTDVPASADASGTQALAAARSERVIGPDGIIPVNFDIGTPGSAGEAVRGDAIVVRKTVRIGTREVGSLPIHVDGRSRLLVDTADLRRMLARAGQDDTLKAGAGKDGLQTFSELRSAGVDLRYDPNSDSVVMTIG